MELILGNSVHGYNEIIISRNCEWDDYYLYAEKLRNILEVNYYKKLGDFDSFYMFFEYNGHQMSFYYNTFLGVSIYPEKGIYASSLDNEMIKILYDHLKKRLSTFIENR